MKHTIENNFLGHINDVAVHKEEHYKVLVELIQTLESRFKVDVTKRFVQDLYDALQNLTTGYDGVLYVLRDVINTAPQFTQVQLKCPGLDFDDLNAVIASRPSVYVIDHYSDEDKQDILLAAMVYDEDFRARYTMTAPYTHGYTVVSPFVKDDFCKAISVGREWFDQLPKALMTYLAKYRPEYDYTDLLTRVRAKVKQVAFGDEPMTRQVANGYEVNLSEDAVIRIISGNYQGTWSTMTPSSQNNLARQLMALRYGDLIEDIPWHEHAKQDDDVRRRLKAILA